MDILSFYDLTEKKQAELIEGMDQIHKEEIENDFYVNIYGSIYGISDFLGGKFEEFEKYFNELNEKNNYFLVILLSNISLLGCSFVVHVCSIAI